MSLDWDKLKVGDQLAYPGLPKQGLWIDAISDQGAAIGGIYVVGPHGFWAHLRQGDVHSERYSLRPPPPLIDPEQVWVKIGDEIFSCVHSHPAGSEHPHFRITATESVKP